MAYLYEISFPTGRKYIGITGKSVEWRYRAHLKDAAAGSPYLVHKAMRKHAGLAVVTTIAEGNWDDLIVLEAKLIAGCRTKVPHGYNMTDGGEGRRGRTGRMSEASRQRMSESHLGKTLSPETRAKIGNALRGYKHSAEMRERVRQSVLGREITDATRAKIGMGVRLAAARRNEVV